jgi:hypothetical protein
LWNGKEISSYEFTVEGFVWMDTGLKRSKAAVTVEKGTVTAKQLEPIQSPTDVGSLDLDNADSVPELFALARKTLLRSRGVFVSSFSARISYNSEFGYPTDINFGSNDLLGRPGEYAYQVTFLRVLPYPQPAK